MSERESVSRDIAAPAETVWAMVSDVTRMGEWSPETTGAKWLGGATGPVAGARFRGSNRNGIFRWRTLATVTVAEPGKEFTFRVSFGPLQVAEWSYTFEPTSAGCRVTETWTDRRWAPTRYGGLVMSGVADRAAHNRAGMAETLDRLAAVAASA